jgi:hypothetical protein
MGGRGGREEGEKEEEKEEGRDLSYVKSQLNCSTDGIYTLKDRTLDGLMDFRPE